MAAVPILNTTKSSISDFFNKIFRELKKDPLSWFFILSITAFFVYFLVVPLIIIIITAFTTENFAVHVRWIYIFPTFDINGSFTLETMKNVLSSRRFIQPGGAPLDYMIRIESQQKYPLTGQTVTYVYIKFKDYGIILNTIIVGILTTLFSLIIGTSIAFIMARYKFPGKVIFQGLMLLPLIVPPFVGGIGFSVMIGPQGLLNQYVFSKYLGLVIIFQGIAGIVFVQTLHFFTLIYLNVYSSLLNIDPSLEEQAENLGASGFRLFRTVTFPLAMPGIASGSILVLILAMEDLGTPIVLYGATGDNAATKVITYEIYNTIIAGEADARINPQATFLGAVLLLFAIVGFFFIRKYVALRQYSMISKGRAGNTRERKVGVLASIGIIAFLMAVFLIATLIQFGIIYRSLVPNAQNPQLTFDNYKNFFNTGAEGLWIPLKNTLMYSFGATFITIILATIAGYVANRKKFPGQSWFDALLTIPIAIPGIVLGMGYWKMFSNSGSLFGIDWLTLNPLNPVLILMISYTVRRFPFTVRAVYAGLQQTDEVLEEAAMNLGASRYRSLLEIVTPLISFNIIGGALISLVYSMGEVSTTLILVLDRNKGTLTWDMAHNTGEIGRLCAIGVFLMIIQAISLFATNFLLKNRAEAITGI